METFNEDIINASELNINDYFEKFYSTFYTDLDTKFMRFSLNCGYKNTDFYIDVNTLKEFNIILSIKSGDILKVIKAANLRVNIDYTNKQKKITTGTKSGLFYNELDYKFTLNAFKLCFISVKNNIREWVCYEECNRYYIEYLQLYSANLSKHIDKNNKNIDNNNKKLECKMVDLKEDIGVLQDIVELLTNKVENLKIELKDNMIYIKKNINTECVNYNKINNVYKYNMFFYNLIILYSLRAFINYMIY